LERGDTVFLEYTGQVHRYVAPVMRTAVLGPPTDEMKRFRDAGLGAIEAVLRTSRSGVSAREVAEAGARALAPVADQVHFHDVYGYMVGIGYPPSWFETLGFELQANNEGLLEEGMVFHVVISLRKFAEFGVSQSQTIVVTAGGAESLTKSDPAMREV
jgi:Xaa-Pro dipeptidase